MCGITGFIDYSAQSSAEILQATISAMTDTLANRGPDDRGQARIPRRPGGNRRGLARTDRASLSGHGGG